MSFLSSLLYQADTALEVVLLFLLLRGQFRKHLLFTFYIAAAAMADIAELIAYYSLGWQSQGYFTVFWTDHILLNLLLFGVVISFTYAAMRESPLRATAPKLLAVISVVALLLPFLLLPNHRSRAHGYFSSQWFNHTIQILNFGAAILNLVLWTALLTNRRRDPQLVTLSIGMGVVTSSAAIAWGARQWLAEANRWPVDIFMTLAHLSAVILWCWLFRPRTQTPGKTAPPAVPPTSPPTAPPDALTTPS